jgi:hypothetical protein
MNGNQPDSSALPTETGAERGRMLRTLLAIVPASLLLLPNLGFPLGSDQSIFFVSAQKILAGAAHYRDIVDIKPPLIYHLYAVAIALFGNGEWSIRLLDLILQIATCWLVATLMLRYSRSLLAPIVATSAYALLYVGLGNQSTAQTESYVGLLGLGAWMLLYRSRTSRHYFLAGMLCGTLFLLKFTLAAMLGVLVVAELMLFRERFAVLFRHALLLLGGFLVVAAMLPFYLLVFDAWEGYREIQQFLGGYVLYQVRSPRAAFGTMMDAMTTHLPGNYSIILLLASAAGIALSLRRSPGAEESGGISGRRLLLRFCALTSAIMILTVAVEGKYFAYQFSRVYPFAVILAGFGIEAILGRGGGFSWRRTLLLVPLAALAILLSPLPHYLWQSAPFALQVTRGSGAVDAYYSRDTMLFARIPLKTVGGHIRSNIRKGERMVALASTGGLVYYHAGYIPDLPIYHSAFLLAPFAPDRWREMTARFIVEEKPRFIVIEHGDRHPTITSTDRTSPDLLKILPGVGSVVATNYRHVMRAGSYELLERVR